MSFYVFVFLQGNSKGKASILSRLTVTIGKVVLKRLFEKKEKKFAIFFYFILFEVAALITGFANLTLPNLI